MHILLNAHPVRQHPGSSPKMSMHHANSWPLACPACNKNIKQPTGEKIIPDILSGISPVFQQDQYSSKQPTGIQDSDFCAILTGEHQEHAEILLAVYQLYIR